MRTSSWALKLAGATAGAVLLSAGLTWAAIELPEQASDRAVEATAEADTTSPDGGRKAGSTGPADEDRGKSVAADVHEVIEDRDGGGCEFGQAVAAAARANSQGKGAGADDPCNREGNGGGRKAASTPADDHEPNGSR